MNDLFGHDRGEEFLVLLPDTDGEGALRVAEALRQAIAAISLSGMDRRLSASVGIAVLPVHAGP